MFCPECGTLGFVDPSGNIRCTNYKCGYEGPVGGKDGASATVIGSDGQEIDIVNTKSSTKSTDLKRLSDPLNLKRPGGFCLYYCLNPRRVGAVPPIRCT